MDFLIYLLWKMREKAVRVTLRFLKDGPTIR